MLSLYLFFGAIVMGITSPLWFGQLFIPVRKLRNGAKWLDKDQVELPATTPTTVEKLRGHEGIGNKIVVPHFLSDWTKDLQRKIFNALLWGSIIAGLVNFLFIVPQASQPNNANLIETLKKNWPIPVFMFIALLQTIFYCMLVADQAAKYASVIDKAKPGQRGTWLKRVKEFFGKSKQESSDVASTGADANSL